MRLQDTGTEDTSTEIAPLSVRTTKAVKEPIKNWISSEGTVRAVNYKHLAFEVEGDVTYLADRGGRRLREGDRVSKGELLATVDERELLADVSQAQAAIAEARQNRAAAAAQIAQAEAQLQQARSQVRQAQSQVRKAQTGRNLAQTDLERYRLLAEEGARLYAPFDGIVAYLNITEGEYYSPQIVTTQLGGDYQGILDRIPMVIIDPAQYEAIADLAGSNGDQVKTGQTALIASEGNMQQTLGISDSFNSGFTTFDNNMSQLPLIDNARARGEVFAVNPAISPGEGRSKLRLD
ncbi:MAG: efflux RND transporter periplasmic adaptor subunit [Xenococcaceae cyanobacterium]